MKRGKWSVVLATRVLAVLAVLAGVLSAGLLIAAPGRAAQQGEAASYHHERPLTGCWPPWCF